MPKKLVTKNTKTKRARVSKSIKIHAANSRAKKIKTAPQTRKVKKIIRKTEKLKNGWGVMVDDLVAGIYSNIVTQLLFVIGVL